MSAQVREAIRGPRLQHRSINHLKAARRSGRLTERLVTRGMVRDVQANRRCSPAAPMILSGEVFVPQQKLLVDGASHVGQKSHPSAVPHAPVYRTALPRVRIFSPYEKHFAIRWLLEELSKHA
jgi:hypothetical protein